MYLRALKAFVTTLALGCSFGAAEGGQVALDGFSLLYRFDGTSKDEHVAAVIAFTGDINGDGFDDILFGASGMSDGTIPGAGTVFLASGYDGRVLWLTSGTSINVGLGHDLARVGDLSNDGIDDVLAGYVGDSDPERVFILSGKDGTILGEFRGDQAYDSFGASMAGLDDLDGDGVADLAIGAAAYDTGGGGSNQGKLRVLSGATGATIREHLGSTPGEFFGELVINAGDVDGDGKSDYAVGVISADPPGTTDAGSVFVFSGMTGQILQRFDGYSSYDAMGKYVSRLRDVNGDGRDEILVGAPSVDYPYVSSGAAYLFSGNDGATIRVHQGDQQYDFIPNGVSWLQDVDADGVEDYFIGEKDGNMFNWAAVYSGASGVLIGTIPCPEPLLNFTLRGSGLGDVNGDGLGDIVLGNVSFSPNGLDYAGSVFVYIANSLVAPSTVAVGGLLNVGITAPRQATKPFQLILSLGNSGVPLGTRKLPVSADTLFFLSLQLAGLRGRLDASGKAALALPIPDDPSISGIVLYGVALGLDPSGPFGVPMISNGVAVTIQ